jgi:hypothetical protein
VSSRYEGGLGTREGGDLVRWSLEIDEHIGYQTISGFRTPVAFRERAPEATLTLHDISRDESIAVIALLNGMRSGPNILTPEQRMPSIGDRFAGLEFE